MKGLAYSVAVIQGADKGMCDHCRLLTTIWAVQLAASPPTTVGGELVPETGAIDHCVEVVARRVIVHPLYLTYHSPCFLENVHQCVGGCADEIYPARFFFLRCSRLPKPKSPQVHLFWYEIQPGWFQGHLECSVSRLQPILHPSCLEKASPKRKVPPSAAQTRLANRNQACPGSRSAGWVPGTVPPFGVDYAPPFA